MYTIKLNDDPLNKIYAGLAREAEYQVRKYRKPAVRFRASEVADCRRKIWYRLSGHIPTPNEPWLSLVGDSGQMHHDYFRHLANHYGFPMKAVTFNEDGTQTEDAFVAKDCEYGGQHFTISARADAVTPIQVEDPVTGTAETVDAVVEIKSMGHFDHDACQRAWKSGGDKALMEVLAEKKANYLWQGNATALARGLDYVYLMLINRSSNGFGLTDATPSAPGTWDPLRGARQGGLAWRVEQHDKDNILSKAAEITKALTDGTPPTPDYVNGSRECNQCAFWVYCHGKKRKAKYPLEGVL